MRSTFQFIQFCLILGMFIMILIPFKAGHEVSGKAASLFEGAKDKVTAMVEETKSNAQQSQ